MTTVNGWSPTCSTVEDAPRASDKARFIERVVDDSPPVGAHTPRVQPCLAVRHHQGRTTHDAPPWPAELAWHRTHPDGAVDQRNVESMARRDRGCGRHPVPGMHDMGTPVPHETPQSKSGHGIEAPATRPASPGDGGFVHLAIESAALERPYAGFPRRRQASCQQQELALEPAVLKTDVGQQHSTPRVSRCTDPLELLSHGQGTSLTRQPPRDDQLPRQSFPREPHADRGSPRREPRAGGCCSCSAGWC